MKNMTTCFRNGASVLAFTWFGLFTPLGARGDMAVETAAKDPPADLAAPLKSLLNSEAVQLRDGDHPAIEFWWRKTVPLKNKPAGPSKGLDAIPETALLGAAWVHESLRDYREDEIRPGLYTVRFAYRPDDGNHLGTSDYRYFAVLTPAATDQTVDAFDSVKALVKASRKDTDSDHPVILSLRPVAADQGPYPRLNEPAPRHKSIVLKLNGQSEGQSGTTDILFDLVYEGVANL